MGKQSGPNVISFLVHDFTRNSMTVLRTWQLYHLDTAFCIPRVNSMSEGNEKTELPEPENGMDGKSTTIRSIPFRSATQNFPGLDDSEAD